MLVFQDPHALLGLHNVENGQQIRLLRPGAQKVCLEVLGQVVEAFPDPSRDLFLFKPSRKITFSDYRIYHHNGLLSYDPYAFSSTISERDLLLFNEGRHYELYSILGAVVKEFEGIRGVQFGIWAPNAAAVSLVADFNGWNGQLNPMRNVGSSGIWTLFVPGIEPGEKYKFEIRTQEGSIRIKSDPLAFYSELRPETASIVFDLNTYCWSGKDLAWRQSLPSLGLDRPMLIYEVHLASWQSYGSPFPSYRQLAVDLCRYCLDMGFTHIELLPIMEHPLDESWGYQVTGFFSATSRFGTPSDFQFFVDYFHQHGIGVLLDWVPAHFPTDDYGLNRFDGTALYEHEDPRKGMHPHWHTAIFNYESNQVSNFLIASALFWFDKMHVDGLRVDAVASMLHLDYGRKEGEWIPNPDGSSYNIPAIEFLRNLNAIVHEKFPGTLMIAEESSAYTAVTQALEAGGLGFDLKWNMGWMNDTLGYFCKDPIYRKFHQNNLSFSLLYAFSEKFLLVLSHDEVVHAKGSLFGKMAGSDWQKLANVRLLYSYMICHPGKKLTFMGNEIGQMDEWNSQSCLQWELLQSPLHRGLHEMVRDLNCFYQKHEALWRSDFDWSGYEWIDFSDAERSTLVYLRKAEGRSLICIHNFSGEIYLDYFVKINNIKRVVQVFNTDAAKYGGSDQSNGAISLDADGFRVVLPSLATLIFEVEFGKN